jgi:hypothetical protein
LLDPIETSMTQLPMPEKQILLCASDILVGFISDGSIDGLVSERSKIGDKHDPIANAREADPFVRE